MSRLELPTLQGNSTVIAANIDTPTVIKPATLPGDHLPSLFIATQSGKIYILSSGHEVRLFLDVRDRVMFQGYDGTYDERGLLGMEFHPKFSSNGYFYLYYSEKGVEGEPVPVLDLDPCNPSSKHQTWKDRHRFFDHIDKLEVWRIDGNHAIPLATPLRVARPFSNHNGSNTLNWYRDRLLISVGDGGHSYDPFDLSQDDDAIFGKIFSLAVNDDPEDPEDRREDRREDPEDRREDPPVTRFSELPPSIQSRVEMLAKGIRNPSSLDVSSLGGNKRRGFLVDVGQNLNEEVNAFADLANLDFGWRPWEGHMPTTVSEDCGGTTVTKTREVDIEHSPVVRINAGDVVRFSSKYGGLVEMDCTFSEAKVPGVNFPSRHQFSEDIPFDRPGVYYFLSQETGSKVKVEVAPLDNKSYSIAYPAEAMVSHAHLPFVSMSHVLDKRPSALSGGREITSSPFGEAFVFVDWSELDGMGKPTGHGNMFYAKPGDDPERLQPYGIIETGIQEYFTTMGTNTGRNRIFLGTSDTIGGRGKGKVHEISIHESPKDRRNVRDRWNVVVVRSSNKRNFS